MRKFLLGIVVGIVTLPVRAAAASDVAVSEAFRGCRVRA
jgi:hypothetical protein